MRLAAAFAIALLPLAANAGPDETTNYFINKKPTLLDFGVYKLRESLRKESPPAVAFYTWDSDDIDIYFFLGVREERTETECRALIEKTRRNAGFHNGSLFEGREISFFANYFTHEGFILGGEEESTKRLKELDKKFRVICWATGAKLEGRLDGTAISTTPREN